MYDTYDKCSKQMYDTVKQLMKLAEENNSDAFFDLTEANKAFFYAKNSLFEIAVAAGLMARNKADILDDFLTVMDSRHFKNIKILCQLAGTLIQKQRCREAVKCFIMKMSNKLSKKDDILFSTSMTKKYILFSAVMADNLEIFKLLYTAENQYSTGFIMLLCGILKSKKILDHLTDCGNNFLNGNINFTLNNDPIVRFISAEKEEETDIFLKWLKNIYSMYFSNETPERSYEIIMNIAKSTGIVNAADNNTPFFSLSRDYYIMIPSDALEREMYIMIMFGHKTNDLTRFFKCCWDIDILMKIAGDEPFITYSCLTDPAPDSGGSFINDSIIKLSKGLKNKLTVKLIDGLNIFDIEMLQDNVKLEIDIENPKTVDYLRFRLMPHNISIKEYPESQQELVKCLIDNEFVTAEKMTEIAASVKNLDILNMLFNYGDEEKDVPQSDGVR